jgi:hypothetical protein
MLTKILSEVVRQPDARLRRAWYHSPTAEVLLEHDADSGAFRSFEIEWDAPGFRRHSVLWARAVGVRTGTIDTGESGDALQYKGAPLFTWHFHPKIDLVRRAVVMILRSGIEEGLRDAVLRRLDESLAAGA